MPSAITTSITNTSNYYYYCYYYHYYYYYHLLLFLRLLLRCSLPVALAIVATITLETTIIVAMCKQTASEDPHRDAQYLLLIALSEELLQADHCPVLGFRV